MQILLTSPEYDILTRYLRSWSHRMMNGVNGADFSVLDRNNVTRDRFEGILQKKDFNVVILNGHGGTDRLAGDNDSIILDRDNVELTKGKKVHALSCKTAQELGPLAIQKGADSYIGYDEDFILVYDESKISQPENDTTAALFLDAAFIAPKALINGKSAQEAVTLAKREYSRSILKAFNSDIQSDNDQFIKYLIWNRSHLKCC